MRERLSQSGSRGLWEGFRQSIANVVQWKKWLEEHSDLIVQAHTVADIRKAKLDGKTAVLLSWQNTAGIEDQLDYLRVFRDLGVRKMQLTYNTKLPRCGLHRVERLRPDWIRTRGCG